MPYYYHFVLLLFLLLSVYHCWIIFQAQLLLNHNISIRQADIPAKNGLYHHVDSVLLPGHINTLLPSQCDEEISEIVTVSMFI